MDHCGLHARRLGLGDDLRRRGLAQQGALMFAQAFDLQRHRIDGFFNADQAGLDQALVD